MTLKLYNTLTRKKEEFKPVQKDEVRMYNCGPTVYDYIHIGNFRAYIVADILRRYLEYNGYKVKQVINITDVGHLTTDADAGEDKVVKRAKEKGMDPWELSSFYAEAFIEDFEKLNLEKPFLFPKATDHIKEIIEIVQKLIENGYAYEVEGNVYFEIDKFKDYGKLSKFKIEELESGRRVEVDPMKKNPNDFVLWFSKSKYPGHIMLWDSPWGKGYPGWHIECSVMSSKYLTDAFEDSKLNPEKFETIDIHTGGEDNMFPHHECEIAQTEGAVKKKFVNYWMHVKHLIVEGKKMSKSLGNFYTPRDLYEKGYGPAEIRYLLLSSHYREQMNFTFDGLKAAKASIERIFDFIRSPESIKESKETIPENLEIQKHIDTVKGKFEEAMDDDLNMPLALAAIFDFIKEINKLTAEGKVGKKNAESIIGQMKEFDNVLGILKFMEKPLPIPEEELKELIAKREAAREKGDFEESDKIRSLLKDKGIILEDTEKGTVWKVV